MSQEVDPREPPGDDELAAPDDAIIGVYLRRSLAVVAAAAVLALVVYFVVGRDPAPPPVAEIRPEAPVEVARESATPVVPFTDVTAAAGLDFVHTNGATGEKLLPESMGSGSAFFDFDNDGDPDLLLVNSSAWPHSATPDGGARTVLYENDGQGRFRDATDDAGLGLVAYATGVAVGDVDNDGWIDVFLTAVGPNHLFRNLGGRFAEEPGAGVAGGAEEWSASAGFFDADRDGDLDLFVANYVRWSRRIDQEVDFRLTGVGRAYGPPINYEGTFPYLYENRGSGADGKITFEDVSAAGGVRIENLATGVPVGKALGIAPIDVDRDGWIDLMVANDTVRNFFFHNRTGTSGGGIRFEETAELYGLAYGRNGEATGAMGIDAAYFRNDSELGFALGNFANEMTSFYLSQGDPTLYADESIGEGIGAPSRRLLSFGVYFLDVDLDGRLDILQVNGHLEGEISKVDPSQSYEQPVQLFWNAGPDAPRGFVEVDLRTAGDLGKPLVGRGGSFADVDGDGDLDLILTQTGRAPLLLRNDQDLGHHWLRLRLVDPEGQRDAIGAWIELVAGGVRQRRQVMPTRGYLSQSELVATFGLGTETSVEDLSVTWPDGLLQNVDVEAVDRLLTIEKDGSR